MRVIHLTFFVILGANWNPKDIANCNTNNDNHTGKQNTTLYCEENVDEGPDEGGSSAPRVHGGGGDWRRQALMRFFGFVDGIWTRRGVPRTRRAPRSEASPWTLTPKPAGKNRPDRQFAEATHEMEEEHIGLAQGAGSRSRSGRGRGRCTAPSWRRAGSSADRRAGA